MRFSVPIVSALLALSESVAAAPHSPRQTNSTARPTFYNGTCTAETVTIRKEWRNMLDEEKSAYIEAQKCLMQLPAQTSLKAVVSLRPKIDKCFRTVLF